MPFFDSSCFEVAYLAAAVGPLYYLLESCLLEEKKLLSGLGLDLFSVAKIFNFYSSLHSSFFYSGFLINALKIPYF